ncbi:4-coumarate--coa ligase 1-like [Plakobranchus ocellatus]|uniref:4-coumarate--coa ligase 1-like n=1 Tax=Plakobranchus ocellatus TaxID=259542 RepID=A0AAV4DYQ4_9GAST|nr:4-coumarate--coa ligase 1-like [Plakobranchus ocellatus]
MARRNFGQQIWTRLQPQFSVSGQLQSATNNSSRLCLSSKVLLWTPQHHPTCHLHSVSRQWKRVTGSPAYALSSAKVLQSDPVPSSRLSPLPVIPAASPSRSVTRVSPADYTQSPVTSDNILRSPVPDIHIPPDLPVHQMVFELCDKYKDKLAVEEFLTGRKYTYTQLKDASFRVASALYRKGYRKGDVLLAFAVNNVDYTVLMVACAAIGVWFSAANPGFTSDELARQLQHSGARGMCISALLSGVAKEAMANKEFPNKVKDLFVFGEASGFQPFGDLLVDDGKAFPDVDVDATKDVFVLPYSSGTTGFPKGVMLSHHNCVANVFQICKLLSPDDQDRCIGLLPLYHIYGMVVVQFVSLMGGASITYLPKFDPESFLKCLHQRKISVAFLVPPLILFLAKHPMVSNFDLTAIKEVVCGAAPLGEELTEEFIARHPSVEALRQGYGMTETSPVTNLDMTQTPGSAGHMLPNTLGKIVDVDSRQTLGMGERGELCVKGPNVMQGYYMNQEATDDMISADGWLYTGDIGYFNEEGVVVIKDRLKELIKYKGSQVAPAELEAVLLSHPDIQDVAVIGVPDQAAGELPKAFVVARPGSNLTPDQVTGFLEGKVAHTKRLRGGVQFIEEIPKNPSGKILRRVLKASNL